MKSSETLRKGRIQIQTARLMIIYCGYGLTLFLQTNPSNCGNVYAKLKEMTLSRTVFLANTELFLNVAQCAERLLRITSKIYKRSYETYSIVAKLTIS